MGRWVYQDPVRLVQEHTSTKFTFSSTNYHLHYTSLPFFISLEIESLKKSLYCYGSRVIEENKVPIVSSEDMAVNRTEVS